MHVARCDGSLVCSLRPLSGALLRQWVCATVLRSNMMQYAAGSPPASSPQAATLATALASAATTNVKATANVIAEAAARKLLLGCS